MEDCPDLQCKAFARSSDVAFVRRGVDNMAHAQLDACGTGRESGRTGAACYDDPVDALSDGHHAGPPL
jgi:hypothetical protein